MSLNTFFILPFSNSEGRLMKQESILHKKKIAALIGELK